MRTEMKVVNTEKDPHRIEVLTNFDIKLIRDALYKALYKTEGVSHIFIDERYCVEIRIGQLFKPIQVAESCVAAILKTHNRDALNLVDHDGNLRLGVFLLGTLIMNIGITSLLIGISKIF